MDDAGVCRFLELGFQYAWSQNKCHMNCWRQAFLLPCVSAGARWVKKNKSSGCSFPNVGCRWHGVHAIPTSRGLRELWGRNCLLSGSHALMMKGFFMVINTIQWCLLFLQKIYVRSVIMSLLPPHTIQLTVVHVLLFYFFLRQAFSNKVYGKC